MLDDPEVTEAPTTATTTDRRRSARTRVAHVAAFVCPEVERIGREVGFPLAVIAATVDPDRHAARLSATWHAGWYPRTREEWFMPFDFGMDPWEDLAYRQLRFDRRWLGSTSLPDGVSLSSGCLLVDLPPGASAADLSAVLCSGLAERSYDRVARRPDRVLQRYATNRPAVVAPRYALATPGNVDKLVVVDDLFAFRPADLPVLAQVVAHARNAVTVGIAMACSARDQGRIDGNADVWPRAGEGPCATP